MKLIDLLNEGKIEYPKGHKPGVKVPKGGSMCANCEYWEPEKNKCHNKYWKNWTGTENVPYPGDQYCCNWWEFGKHEMKKPEKKKD